MVKIYRGKIIPKSNSGIYPVYSSSIQNNGLMGFSNEYMFDDEKITWSIDGGGNFFFRKKHKYSVTNVSGIIDVTSDLINIVFLFYQLYKQQKKYKFDYQLKAHPSVIKKIYKIYLPDITIQNKIASLFLCLDELILLYEEKLAALETYNKGLRQKLFNQSIRFKRPDGSNYSKWEEKNLVNIATIIMGQSPGSNTYNCEKKGVPLIQGNADIFERKTSPSRYTEKPTKMCKKGDIIMTVRAPVGYTCKSNHIACIGRGVCAIKPKCNSEFLFQFLINIEKQWRKIEQGSTFTAINSNDLSKLNILLPCLEEQQKIADILSCSDKLIEQIKEKISFLKNTKTNLLNNMFN